MTTTKQVSERMELNIKLQQSFMTFSTVKKTKIYYYLKQRVLDMCTDQQLFFKAFHFLAAFISSSLYSACGNLLLSTKQDYMNLR